MLYIKQMILRVITEMDLNECAEIKKYPIRKQQIDMVNTGSFLLLFIWQTLRCANL